MTGESHLPRTKLDSSSQAKMESIDEEDDLEIDVRVSVSVGVGVVQETGWCQTLLSADCEDRLDRLDSKGEMAGKEKGGMQ